MKQKVRIALFQVYGIATGEHQLDAFLSLMGENGNGVSDSPGTNGALPHVGKSECLRSDSTEVSSESEQGTLENRIDSGNQFKCDKCGIGFKYIPDLKHHVLTTKCGEFVKES